MSLACVLLSPPASRMINSRPVRLKYTTQSVEPLGEDLGLADFGRHWNVAAWIQEVNTSTLASDLKLAVRVDKVGYAVENASPFHFLVSVMRESPHTVSDFGKRVKGVFITEHTGEMQRATEYGHYWG